MTNRVLLNNIDHLDLRIITQGGAEYGDASNQVAVLPTEFAEVQKDYPILFRKDAEGKFQSVALLGFDRDENLFLSDEGWMSRHIPAILQRGPFLIGFQDQMIDGQVQREPVIFVDLDHPRVSRTDGVPVFLPQGGNSPYLQHISHVLRVIRKGVDVEDAMFAAFEAADLIEPATIEIQLDRTTTYKVPDVFTLNEEKVSQLEGETLSHLHRTGFLRLAFFVLSSLGNMNRLIELKNARRTAQATV